jgi:release factor glutamine methyltransferase
VTLLLRPPGVYRAQDDTSLLVEAIHRGDHARGRSVLDVGTGSGALAIAAARAGAASVDAVDLSLRSAATARVNAWINGAAVAVHRGDLFAPVADRRFDLVLTNPPYVPSRGGLLPRHRMGRCWDAGPDGRALLDRICTGAPDVLARGGLLLLVQSEFSGEEATLHAMRAAGLKTEIVGRTRIPFGPVLRERLPLLRERGLLAPWQTDEGLVVLAGRAR